MSGTIDTLAGKVPQRAIRYLDQLPYVATYTSNQDFGAGDSFVFATPASRYAKVTEVQLHNVTETFNSVTTAASVEIGDGSDADGFAYTDDFADGTAAQVFTTYDDTITAGVLGDIIGPGDQVTATAVAPTGGTPTGIADVSVSVLLFSLT